jgi:hypothetical protein
MTKPLEIIGVPTHHTLILLSANELCALKIALGDAVGSLKRDHFMMRFTMLPEQAWEILEKLSAAQKVARHHRYNPPVPRERKV